MNAIELLTAILILWLASWLTLLLSEALNIHLFLASGMTVTGSVLLISMIHSLLKGRINRLDR